MGQRIDRDKIMDQSKEMETKYIKYMDDKRSAPKRERARELEKISI